MERTFPQRMKKYDKQGLDLWYAEGVCEKKESFSRFSLF